MECVGCIYILSNTHTPTVKEKEVVNLRVRHGAWEELKRRKGRGDDAHIF